VHQASGDQLMPPLSNTLPILKLVQEFAKPFIVGVLSEDPLEGACAIRWCRLLPHATRSGHYHVKRQTGWHWG
jgi:hypothetical protein